MDPSSGLVPMEDSVQALIDHLVYPLLPLRSSSKEPPSPIQQEKVAKQMHAVVLLYNYYHRKRFPQLEFLGFESFCKAATIAKASLVVYMKFMRNGQKELRHNDKELSFAEKMVMDACKICTALDASKGSPDTKDWPISKVAIFLADPLKEKCLLQFSTVTQGVWSVIEENIETTEGNLISVRQMKKDELNSGTTAGISQGFSADDDLLQQLAFSVVEQKTGINKSNLRILEHHLVYSHTEEKRIAQIYIMTYMQAANDDFTEVPINDVMSSLEGPLLKPGLTPVVTPVVEYCHLLPYADILSKWLSRETADDQKLQADVNNEFSCEPNRMPATEDHKISNKSDKTEQTIDILTKKIKKPDNEAVNKKRSDSSCMTDSSHDIIGLQSNSNVSYAEAKRSSKGQDHAMKDRFSLSSKEDGMKREVAGSGENLVFPRSPHEVVYKRQSKLNGSSVKHPQQPLPHGEDTKHLDNVISTKSVINVAMAGPADKIIASSVQPTDIYHAQRSLLFQGEQVDAFKRHDITTSRDEGSLGRSGQTDARTHEVPGEDSIGRTDLPLVPMQHKLKSNLFPFVTMSKRHDLLKVSLVVLQRKQEAMCNQQRLLEDEIAQGEMKIQTIISEAEKEDSSDIESIIEACDLLCSSEVHMDNSTYCEGRSSNNPFKRKRLHEAVFSSKSPCQELDYICCENNWILPRYSVLPSYTEGMFHAEVVVQGADFECSINGELRSSPREARESAASHMLNKLRT